MPSRDLTLLNNRESLSSAEFSVLADIPPELEWLANITNAKTRRAYKKDITEFLAFTGLQESAQLRTVSRSHVIAWRKDMEQRSLAPASIRAKLSALSSLFDYLCERNAVLGNPVDGVKRPAQITMKAAPLPSVTRTQEGFWMRLRRIRSKACATAPSCSITVSAVKNCACCGRRTCRAARA